jgi:branched-chain amino acid transport system substrate-binding protein
MGASCIMSTIDRTSRLSRRRALRAAVGVTLGAAALPLLAACGSAGTGGQPTAAPAKPTEPARSAEAAKPSDKLAEKPAQQAPAAQATVSEVNIAALFPISGDLARPGETCMNAAKLAADDINAAGGVKALGGAKINLITADLQSDDKVTRTETERVLTTNKITAVNAAYASALSLVASEVTERQKVPMITGSVANQLVERGFKYIFQGSPRASMFGEAQIKVAGEAAGGEKKIGVVFENTAYGTSTSKGINDFAQEAGFEVVLNEPYEKSFTDAGPLVNKIKGSGAKVLFPVAYLNDTVLIVRTMKQQSVRMPIIAGGAGPLLPDFGRTFGEDANGVLVIGAWNWDMNGESRQIDQKYRARHNEYIHEHAGEVYAYMYVLLDAIERAASVDPEAVREALARTNLTKGFGAAMPAAGGVGKVSFDEKGWNSNAVALGMQWQKGELVTVYPSDWAKAQLINQA